MHGQQPLTGVFLCCTSLTPDVRTKLARTASEMGAVHKLDLTADVTHLLVGSVDTPKYRYVAKERPDIAVLRPEWIDAVRQAWMEGEDEVDVAALEREYTLPPFFGLQMSITGFEDIEQRSDIEATVTRYGGTYSGDMTKATTHLVVADARLKSAKFTHARQWGIHTVSFKWFQDSIERGMALEETLYTPELPLDQQGLGAFRRSAQQPRTSLGKRPRNGGPLDNDDDKGPSRRKLRKTTSMRLEGQSQDLWQDISAQDIQVETSGINAWNDESQTLRPAREQPPEGRGKTVNAAQTEIIDAQAQPKPQGLFSGHFILIHGFPPDKTKAIKKFLEPDGATVVSSVAELEDASEDDSFRHRCLLVPHKASAPTLPEVPPGTRIATEWWVERCLHYKRLFDPQEDALSQLLSRIPECAGLAVSTTGFTGITLLQVARAVAIMGASYEEKLLPQTSVLVCASDKIREEKRYYAAKHNIPTVSADWLWTTLRSRRREPFNEYSLKVGAFPGREAPAAPLSNSSAQVNEQKQKSDSQKPKRLSSSRRHNPTPSLPLQLSATSSNKRAGPFILEDDDDLVTAPTAQVDDDKARDTPGILAEIRPHASQRNISQPQESATSEDGLDGGPAENEHLNDMDSNPQDQNQSPTKSASSGLRKTDAEYASDLLALRAQQAASRAGSLEPAARRKRPLGRNKSWISSPSLDTGSERQSSLRGSAQPPSDINAIADGFRISHEGFDAIPPPGTQLGYEMEDAAEAHRQLSKKIGCSLIDKEHIIGSRVASVGTMKDSGFNALQDSRASRRTRQKR